MLLEPGPFRQRLILFLLPYFLAVAPDFEVAQAEALETLVSYGPRNRAEAMNASRVIAFSFSALDVLYEANATEMPPAMRLRFNGCANNLNRSCQQNEQMLARRLACDLPGAAQPAAEPVDDLPDTEFQAALQHAEAQIAAYRNRLSGARPASSHPPASDTPQGTPRRPDSAVTMDVFGEIEMPRASSPVAVPNAAAQSPGFQALAANADLKDRRNLPSVQAFSAHEHRQT